MSNGAPWWASPEQPIEDTLALRAAQQVQQLARRKRREARRAEKAEDERIAAEKAARKARRQERQREQAAVEQEQINRSDLVERRKAQAAGLRPVKDAAPVASGPELTPVGWAVGGALIGGLGSSFMGWRMPLLWAAGTGAGGYALGTMLLGAK